MELKNILVIQSIHKGPITISNIKKTKAQLLSKRTKAQLQGKERL